MKLSEALARQGGAWLHLVIIWNLDLPEALCGL